MKPNIQFTEFSQVFRQYDRISVIKMWNKFRENPNGFMSDLQFYERESLEQKLSQIEAEEKQRKETIEIEKKANEIVSMESKTYTFFNFLSLKNLFQ